MKKIFIDPYGRNKQFVESKINEAVMLLIEFLSSGEGKPLLPTEEMLSSLNLEIPDNPYSEDKLLSELVQTMSLSMNPANPSYIGHMDSLPTIYSIIGSLFSAALNNNMFSLEMSPYFTRLEYALTNQFAKLFGLPTSATGVIVSGGTLSNIQAIITARNYFLKSNDGDISKSKGKMVLFASEHAHISVKKAAMMSGLGVESLIPVITDKNGKMDMNDLQIKINKAKESKQSPFAVVATLGTTVTGNIDPIKEIVSICRRENIWLHADAIYGGAIILSNKEKYRLSGIEHADSISFNPQKWMHISKTCSLLLFRDAHILNQYFGMKASYVKEQDEYINLSELNIQGTKHADVLKLWLSVLSVGLSGYEKLIDQSYDTTSKFIQKLKKIPNVEFVTKTEMNIPTFRLISSDENNSNGLNQSFNEFALKEYNIFFSLPTYEGKLWQRTILLNPFIDDSIINRVFEAISTFNDNIMK